MKYGGLKPSILPARRTSLYLAIGSVIYMILAHFTTGLRSDHLLLVFIVNACYLYNDNTRRFITGFSIFVVYWLIFDSMKLWPNYLFAPVDIQHLYELEKKLFGIGLDGGIITPNEFFLMNSNTFLDVLTGSFYLCWIPVPLLFALYLYNYHKNLFLRFCLCFFVTNLIGFVIYYTHPAAAPWYMAEYGNVFHPDTPSNAAGLLRFDRYFGITLFEDLYAKGSNVFAAMPSLHSSYPLVAFWYALKQPARWLTIIIGTVMTGIWFSAIYLSHHYILDVLAGISCGIAGIYVLEGILLKRKFFSGFIQRFEKSITSPAYARREKISA